MVGLGTIPKDFFKKCSGPMKVILDIPENKYKFFLELVRSLTFVKIEENDTIPQWQMDEVNKRLDKHKNNPEQAMDFDAAMDDIEKDL